MLQAPAITADSDENPIATALRHAHTLRGVASSIGAGKLSALAHELEAGCQNAEQLQANTEELKQCLEAVSAELQLIFTGLDEWAEAEHSSLQQTAGESQDSEAIANHLPELRRMLESFDINAQGAVAELAQMVTTTAYQADIEALHKAVDNFDFTAALATLDALEPQLLQQ